MASTTPQRVLVTGGAGLIGSHIVDLLMDGREQGKYSDIVIVDNFVRGRHENIAAAKARGELSVIEGDIGDRALMADVMQGIDLVFHLAAICSATAPSMCWMRRSRPA
jgi:UDP-glucose 4-epimerase